MAYNIKTTQSTFKYPSLSTINDGLSYFIDGWTKEVTAYDRRTVTGSYREIIIGVTTVPNKSNMYMFHVYGTITRDITDNAEYYAYSNAYPILDNYTYIPVDHSSNVTRVDTVMFTSHKFANFSGFQSEFKIYDKDKNLISTTNTINLNIDRYCI